MYYIDYQNFFPKICLMTRETMQWISQYRITLGSIMNHVAIQRLVQFSMAPCYVYVLGLLPSPFNLTPIRTNPETPSATNNARAAALPHASALPCLPR
jgi:hypothetical protein